MNGNLKIFDQVLQKLKFKQPVPVKIQKQILNFKRITIVSTLKEFGEYNLIYGLILRLHFFITRLGIGLSTAQSEILFFILTILAAGITIIGTALLAGIIDFSSYKAALIEKIDIPISHEKNEGIKSHIQKEKERLVRKEAPVKTRLSIKIFHTDISHKDIASEISNKLYISLKRLKGNNRVVFRDSNINKSVNRLLLGRLSKVGNTYLLSLRIIDAESGKLYFDKILTYNEIEDLHNKLDMFAGQISSIGEIW